MKNFEEFSFPHPYEYEINNLDLNQLDIVDSVQVQNPSKLATDNLFFVNSTETLDKMMQDLQCEKEIAVDLEHNHKRSFQGITCLIQISTRKNDYIIDPFPIWNQLQLLNKVFTDKKITKVFHGADFDVQWLERDFGVYVVNMFDTHQASITLKLPTHSLAYLLTKYCNVVTDKSHQLDDWRLRPLTKEQWHYARGDTHYLL